MLPARLLTKLLLFIVIVAAAYYGRSVLIPLATAGLLALTFDPLHERFKKWGMSGGVSAGACLFILSLFFAGISFAFGQQASGFAEDWPDIRERGVEKIEQIKEQFIPSGMAAQTEESGSTAPKGDQGQSAGQDSTARTPVGSPLPMPSGSRVTGALSSTVGILGDFLLMLVYFFLLLTQKNRLREFVLRRMPDDERGETHRAINESAEVAQGYLKGQIMLISILAVLYGIGFSIVGLEYGLLIAVLAAVFSLIPYLGNIIGGFLALAVAFAGGGGNTVLIGVIITMSIAQLVESYILTPLVVGKEVDLNPLVTIVCVVAFTAVWGPIGAVVSIPFTAIFKVLSQRIPGMSDYAYLLSDGEE